MKVTEYILCVPPRVYLQWKKAGSPGFWNWATAQDFKSLGIKKTTQEPDAGMASVVVTNPEADYKNW